MKKQVSVIIPNFNGRDYLKDCLASLNQQHFRDFEVILVDNASTDDSLSLAKELCPAIKEILLSENFGFCRAPGVFRNEIAPAEFIDEYGYELKL